MLTGKYLVGCCYNGIGELGVEASGLLVGQRRGFLDLHLRGYERFEGQQAADRKVLFGAQRLDAVQGIDRNVEGAERILFATRVSHGRFDR
jgi:hypothetical protein